MTTFASRPNTALLIIDMQRGVVEGAHDRDAVIANINTVLGRARDAAVPVIWIQHADDNLVEGTDGWQYVDELKREDSEPLVHKHYGDSFEETDLERLLAERKVGKLVVTGAQTDACVRSTLHGALVRGYDAMLVSDAHTTEDPSQWGAPLERGASHRPHQPVLDLLRGARPFGRHRRDRGPRLQRFGLTERRLRAFASASAPASTHREVWSITALACSTSSRETSVKEMAASVPHVTFNAATS